MNREVTIKETIELFINTIIYDIINEVEIPRINFIFNDEAYKLFYEVMKNPFSLNNSWTPDIKEEDISLFFLTGQVEYNMEDIKKEENLLEINEIEENGIKIANKKAHNSKTI